MVLFNYATRELTAKIVYYGPGLCGKTTNLQYIHENLPGQVKGKMLSLATKTDRTLFFDFLPIDLGEIRGMKTRVQLYTVPGQVFYNETRKLVLKGADGIVFVADSQEAMISANVESFKNLEENLRHHNMNLAEMPHIIQFNKRDLPKVANVEELNTAVNKYNAPFYEAVATTGIGVQDTLKAITKLVLLHLTKKYDPEASAGKSQVAVPSTPSVAIPAPEAPIAPAAQAAPSTPSMQPGMNNPGVNPPPQALDLSPSFSIDSPAEQNITDVNSPSAPSFSASVDTGEDVDDLMAEIAEAPAIPIGDQTQMIDTPNFNGPSFELDAGSAASESSDSQAAQPATPSAQENTSMDFGSSSYSQEAAEDEVLLNEVATDEDLFNAANLDVATMASGEEREIVIPIQLDSGAGLKPFKLSVRLKLDPAEE